MNREKTDVRDGRMLVRIFRLVLVPVIAGIFFGSCVGYLDKEKYRRPAWLAGKLYTQITLEDELSEFARCIEITGWDTILDVSGVFTVFAPSNQAVDKYLADHQYQSVSEIPPDELRDLVEYHIVQNPWSEEQLQTLSANGWVDPDDPFSRPNAYKRQTVLKEPDEKYWVLPYKGRDMIMLDSSRATSYRRVYTKSRKYVPIFFDEFFNIYGLSYEDYSYYFNRPYESGNIYFAGARVTKAQILAENGFIYIIDRLEGPLPNAREMLEEERPGERYRSFLDLVYRHYPTFSVNLAATQSQYAVRYGGIVDTLWDLSFNPGLPFDLHEELTGDRTYQESRYTLNHHYGMIVPTDDAFRTFVEGTLTAQSGYPHWRDIASVPNDIVNIIVQPHFFRNPVFESNIFDMVSDDQLRQDISEDHIVHREFGSNSTFIGVDSYTPSRLFTSVTGPAYLQSRFTLFRRALESTNMARQFANLDGEFLLVYISDISLNNEQSLIINYTNEEQTEYYFTVFDQYSQSVIALPPWEPWTSLSNQIGISVPDGSANKEFIRTMGGNFIIWNNEENTIQGNTPCTFGFNGDSVIICHQSKLPEPADNGEAWYTTSWLNYNNPGMTQVLPRFPAFVSLLERAGLSPVNSNRIPALQDNRSYTLFIPTAEALQDYQVDTLSDDELKDFLLFHIVQGILIFTDNKIMSGAYSTLREDETSTPEDPSFSSLNLRTSPDLIEVLDVNGDAYVTIPEETDVTNQLVATNGRINRVIHRIDKVLINQ